VATAFQITAVHTVKPSDRSHEHIERVELNNNPRARISRAIVIKDLRDPYGDRYYTYGGGYRADVVVRGCPYCSFGSYITTLPDSTTTNNLLTLPRF
jgi:hypothetical protein